MRVTSAKRYSAVQGVRTGHDSINADIAVVVLHRRAKDVRVFGEIPLSQVVMTQRARAVDVQSDLVSEQERTADPLILDELLVPAGKIDDEVRAEAGRLERLPGDSEPRWLSVADMTR